MTGELATESHNLKKKYFFKHKSFVWPTVHKWFAGKRDRREILTHREIPSQKMQSRVPAQLSASTRAQQPGLGTTEQLRLPACFSAS